MYAEHIQQYSPYVLGISLLLLNIIPFFFMFGNLKSGKLDKELVAHMLPLVLSFSILYITYIFILNNDKYKYDNYDFGIIIFMIIFHIYVCICSFIFKNQDSNEMKNHIAFSIKLIYAIFIVCLLLLIGYSNINYKFIEEYGKFILIASFIVFIIWNFIMMCCKDFKIDNIIFLIISTILTLISLILTIFLKTKYSLYDFVVFGVALIGLIIYCIIGWFVLINKFIEENEHKEDIIGLFFPILFSILMLIYSICIIVYK